ncbi:DsbA family protein [Hymenobacter busanensis]|uniref:DsbA family protein n=1 Tax=Hymenobacter busanensis TaxID=2607656 RepID=A0A7L4ZZA3_9BACT|nr:thioredoxin domain-containing protein [Hymenobacter busanensis]KAA9331424.1 DsbA family protein [Hymenobacter busanensis]QHJ08578.1 thioredoxin domain-containing protein [Hymenobacter busanensis]
MTQHSGKNWLLISLGIAQAVLLLVLLYSIYQVNAGLADLNRTLTLFMQSGSAGPGNKIKVSLGDELPYMGVKDAKVVMTILSDFECDYCREFAQRILPKLKSEYVDKGKLKIIFKDLPLPMHKNALMAAEAASCAHEQGRFWNMHDYLFANQGKFGLEFFTQWAASAQLDTQKYGQCMAEHRYIKPIENSIIEATSAGIQGTPAIIVNGQLTMGTKPYAYFAQLIDSQLDGGVAQR